MKSIEKQINFIIQETDFNKIHKVMDFLGWTWNFEKGARTPTKKELQIAAVHCIRKAWISEDKIYNSGGFECEVIDGTIELKFIIERVNPLSKIFS